MESILLSWNEGKIETCPHNKKKKIDISTNNTSLKKSIKDIPKKGIPDVLMIKETGKDISKSKQILSVYNNNVLLLRFFP